MSEKRIYILFLLHSLVLTTSCGYAIFVAHVFELASFPENLTLLYRLFFIFHCRSNLIFQ